MKYPGFDVLLQSHMRVVLDTNIFHGHWHLSGASFTYLFHYLNNEYTQLLLPEIVRREVNNIQSRDLRAAIASAETQLNKAAHLNGTSVTGVPLTVTTTDYDLLTLLEDRVDDLVVIEHENVPQSAVVERALQKKRPFQDNGAGYRDTLIWLSLLAHLDKDKSTEPVAFITKNSSDFFESKGNGKPKFHPHLVEDLTIASLSIVIIPFVNLDSFVESTIDKDTHALDYNRVEDFVGEYLEDEAIKALETRDSAFLAVLSDRLTPGTALLRAAQSIAVEVFEGIEDFSVLYTKDLGDDDVYVRVDFDLRIVEFAFVVPLGSYTQAELAFRNSNPFYDAQVSTDSVTLITSIRPRFEAGVIYNRRTSETSAFEVVDFRVMR